MTPGILQSLCVVAPSYSNISECLSQPVHCMCVCTCLNCASYALFHTWSISISQRLHHGRIVERRACHYNTWHLVHADQNARINVWNSSGIYIYIYIEIHSTGVIWHGQHAYDVIKCDNMLRQSTLNPICSGKPVFAKTHHYQPKLPPPQVVTSSQFVIQYNPDMLSRQARFPFGICGLRTNSVLLWLRWCTKTLWWD